MSSPSVDSPEPRNITEEMLQTLSGYRQTAGPQFELESRYQPQYNQLNLRMLEQSLLGYDDEHGVHHPGQLEFNRLATTAQRTGDVSDVERLGLRSSNAFLDANPRLRAALDALQARSGDSDILRTLNTQANEGLAQGGRLTPQEITDLQQQSRAGFADRGMVNGPISLGAELLSRDSAVRQRMAGAQQFASGVQGLNQGQNDFVGRVAQINASALSDPFMAILGRSSGAGASSGAGGGMIGTGAKMFDPTNAYASDIYNFNANAEAAANIANANSKAATQGAWIGAGGAAIGTIGAAIIM